MIVTISRMTNMRKITTTTTMMMWMAIVTMMMLMTLLLLLMMSSGSNKVNSFLNMAMEECTGKENCNKGFSQNFSIYI